MKIFLFFTSIIIVALLVWQKSDTAAVSVPAPLIYRNPKYAYEILLPSGFEVNDDVLELTTLTKDDFRLRVNVGCLAMGTEALTGFLEPLFLNGIPASKEDFYQDSRLQLRQITFYGKDGQCFSLEEQAKDEQGWRELAELRKGFQLLDN